MLNRVEAKIMNYLFEKCRPKKTVLMTPKEILHAILPKHELTAKELDKIIKNLAIDGYIDVYNSDKDGQLMYVVTLKTKGEAYDRERMASRKRLYFRIGLTVVLALLSFTITFTLRAMIG